MKLQKLLLCCALFSAPTWANTLPPSASAKPTETPAKSVVKPEANSPKSTTPIQTLVTTPALTCDSQQNLLAQSSLNTVMVTAEQSHFFRAPNCSSENLLCQSSVHLAQGDRAIASDAVKGWRCVAYVNGTHAFTGWMKDQDVAVLAQKKPSDPQLRGIWAMGYHRDYLATLRILHRDSQQWYVAGALTSANDKVIANNVADFGGYGEVSNGVLNLSSALPSDSASSGAATAKTCQMTLRLLSSDRLSVSTSGQCDALAKRETGIYQRLIYR